MTTQSHTQTPLERLRHHVSGAIARGEAAPVVQITAPATHTPGPWETKRAATPEAFPQFGVYAENGNGRDLAHVVSAGTTRHAETEANARLIAAAPEMLEALRAMVARAPFIDQSATAEGLANCEALAKARHAIRQSEGEQ